MSVVIAIKKNDRIYMAADTLTSCGEVGTTYLGKDSRKICQFENGILLGHTGSVHNWQIVRSHPEYFTIPEDGIMTKKYVVQNIMPRIHKCYRDYEMIVKEEDEPAKMEESYILAFKDKMFVIDGVFCVEALDHFAEIGSGGDVTLAGLRWLDVQESMDGEQINKSLVDILRISDSRTRSVAAPFYLIDTVEQKFTLAE